MALACLLAVTAARAQTGSVEPPVMGWSSWNTYRVNISDELIMKQADAMVAGGLKDAGYCFVNIDDGFFGFRDSEGVLHTHPERFPNGLEGVVKHIHSLGLKAGIYSDAGANTCGSLWDADKNGVGVGMYGFERQDADLFFNKWGFDYIKIDYCGAGQQLELDERERYSYIVGAIREVCPRNISVNVCRWAYPGTWVKDIARSWRISSDISASWESVKNVISKNLYLAAFAGGGHYNDMDMLEVGRGMSTTEDETHFGMWCMMSSPLMIGCDLTSISGHTLELLKNPELIAVNQDRLGLQAYVVQHKDGGYVLVKDIESRRGCVRAVAFYNPTDAECSFDVPLSVLELAGKARVRDLVRRKDEPVVVGSIRFDVPPHGVKVMRVEGERRMEPAVYEAENACLAMFDDLAKRKRGVAFMPFDRASGGMVVTNLGGQPGNYAQWNEVYSEKGGRYRMTVYYVPAGDKKCGEWISCVNDYRMEISVNGDSFFIDSPEASGNEVVGTDIVVDLKKGYNVVRIGSRLTWTPDIDCFVLQPM